MGQIHNIQKLPYLESVSACVQGSFKTGYTEKFIPWNGGYISTVTNKFYTDKQITIISQMHFEGNCRTEIADITLIETDDGGKGIVYRRLDNW
ncbi:MAG: hypothetical protein EOO04_00940 [Chitinophagaceae bacterium]|nr:MAG: hypothetical protein EOO04_00940 [Chitinophagaceae bacterium]